MGECLINSEIINKIYLLVLLMVHKGEKSAMLTVIQQKNAMPGPGLEENTPLLQGGVLRLSE